MSVLSAVEGPFYYNPAFQRRPNARRAFRDVHAAVAHIALNWEPAATAYGKVALGLPPDNPLL